MNRVLFRALFGGAMLLSPVAVQAATLTVTSDGDAGGTCPGATCTLRQAIATASPGDTIDFAGGITTIDLTSAELLIDKNLTINGAGANLLTVRRSAVAGTPDFRIFRITAGNVTLSGLTIANGRQLNGSGGGILNDTGTLTVAGCSISGNSASVMTGTGGGGIFNSNGGTVNVIRSTLSSNYGNCPFGSCGGGGVFNSTGGTMNITNSTLSANSTFSGNSGAGGNGVFNSAGGTVNIANSTLSANYNGFRGGGVHNEGTVNARNTIMANNSTRSGIGQDFDGTLVSQGYNLIRATNNTTITGDTTGNQLNVDPLIGPLQDNGGPTFTHALLPGSTAIDGGHSSGSSTDQRGLPRPVDDPGLPNATGGDGSDIGAFEVQTFTPTPTPTSTPTPGPTATPSLTATPARSLNISTRSRVQTGDNVMIGGFIVTGNAPKKVILRAIGPSLQRFGLTGVLADPMLELHGPNGALILSSDNWRENPDQALLIQESGIPPQDDLESAIVATLPPAGYTAVVRGKSNGTGLGLVEVYDLEQSSDSKLANISTRAIVETGDNVVIGGFILGGTAGSPRIIIRAIGPSLAPLGIANPLADPTLELRDGNGMLLAFDDNWRDNPAQAALIMMAGVQPQNDLEAAIAATLPPGAYTAIVAGRNGGIGVGLVEVYNLQ